MQSGALRDLDWRGWIDRFARARCSGTSTSRRRARWGCYESLRGLYPDMHREFAPFMATAYPAGCRELEGDRPPLSIDIVAGVPAAGASSRTARWCSSSSTACGSTSGRVLEPLLAPLFDMETTHYFAVLPTATPYARNALFSGLFPGEIAARFPDWWGEREDETLNAHERELLEAQLVRARGTRCRCATRRSRSAPTRTTSSGTWPNAIAPDGICAFVFNFVDLLTHGRIGVDDPVRGGARRDRAARSSRGSGSSGRRCSAAAGSGAPEGHGALTSDHGSIHCHTPATVFAKRDATPNLRYKFGEDLRAENARAGAAVQATRMPALPQRGLGANTLLAAGDSFFVYPDEAARVPEPLSRVVPARRRDAGGVHPARVAAHAEALTPHVSPAPARSFASARVADGRDGRVATSIAAVLDVFSFTLLRPVPERAVRRAAADPGAAPALDHGAARAHDRRVPRSRPTGCGSLRRRDRRDHRRSSRSRTSSCGSPASSARRCRSTSRATCATRSSRTCSGCRSAGSSARRRGRSSRACSPTPSRRRRSSPSW